MNKEKEELVLLDSQCEIPMDAIKDHCESNGIPVPEEGSSEYWELVGSFRDWDCDDFKNDMCYNLNLGKCLVTGYAGLWDGRHAGGTIIEVNKGGDLFQLVRNCDDLKVVIDPDDGLVVYGYHHDGTNRYVVRQLNKRGLNYIADKDDMNSRELHERLLKGKMTKKITLKMITG